MEMNHDVVHVAANQHEALVLRSATKETVVFAKRGTFVWLGETPANPVFVNTRVCFGPDVRLRASAPDGTMVWQHGGLLVLSGGRLYNTWEKQGIRVSMADLEGCCPPWVVV